MSKEFLRKYTISILMVVYEGDKDKYFYESLNSLVSNKFYFDELVLVINGPINLNKKSSINHFKNFFKIEEVFLNNNYGISKALNEGLKFIKSDWVVRFDSDDICCPDRFMNINKLLNNNGENYDVIGTYIFEFTNSINNIKQVRKVPLKLCKLNYRFIFSNPMNHVSVIFRRSLTQDFIGSVFYPELDGFEDYLLWAKLLKNKKKFLNVPINTVYVRVGEDMLRRRGGLKYIKKEIIFRLKLIKYIGFVQIPFNLLVLVLRVFLFSLHFKLKEYAYFIFRKIMVNF